VHSGILSYQEGIIKLGVDGKEGNCTEKEESGIFPHRRNKQGKAFL